MRYVGTGGGRANLAPWHNGRMNLLFIDGHARSFSAVEWVPASDSNEKYFYPAQDLSVDAPSPPPLPN
ncbi:MAG: H-X9-DG-CTERM domain-containing protein [Planctomycetota bacterium]